MLKRLLLYFIGFVVLASLAFYGFSRWQASREKVDLWEIVPESAAIVVETNNHQALANHLSSTELWQNMEVLPIMQEFQEHMALLDSVSPSQQRLNRFFDKKNILTSVHVTGKSTLNFIFYVPVSSVGEHRFLRSITDNLAKNPDFEQSSRRYNGAVLTEVVYKPLNLRYTYFSYHNNIIISASAALIEEVVRRAALDDPTSIAADYESANYLNQPDVYANVFFNYREIPAVLNLFLKDDLMPEVRYLSSLCRSGMMQLKLEENKIFLNGFSNPEPLKGSFHNTLGAVKPKPILVKEYLPVRTAVLLHFGVQQLARLKQQDQKEIADAFEATIDSLATTFRQELALAYLESNSTRTTPEKVVYARTGNKQHTLQLLGLLREQAATKRAYTGTYGGYRILQMAVPELPARLFGDLFTGFEQVYAIELEDYIVFADELSTAQGLIDDVLAEKVWSKSGAWQSLQEETLQEANFSLFINTVNAWYILSRYTSENKRETLLQASSFIKKFNQVAIQFARVEGQYYTSMVFRKQESSATAESNYDLAFTLPFTSRLESRPFAVQNVVDRTRSVVVQDSAYTLHHITADGKRTWTDSLGSSIRGSIKQLPLGPDNRLRYLFATSNRIHAINNQGQPLENFPFNLTDTLNIQRLTIFDYDKSGNYNLLVDDEQGNLYMYDIRGNAIPGWQPRRLDHKLAAAPEHLRIGTRDVIVALLENGYVYALNKNGDTYQGFPFSLKSPVTSGVVISETGPDLRRTELKTVTRYGEVITFNLQGRVLQREKLPRPSKRAMFELVPDESEGRNHIFVRQEQGKIAIFDREQKLLFEKRFVTSAPKIVQYFNFGGDNIIYAITETGPQKTYLYNATGKLIGEKPLDNNKPVTIYHNEAENTYSLYKAHQKELQKINFRLKR